MADGRFENWCVVEDNSDPYRAPEARAKWVEGNIYGSRRFADGKYVHTSNIDSLDLSTRLVHTMNSVYELGQPKDDYAAIYPRSRMPV